MDRETSEDVTALVIGATLGALFISILCILTEADFGEHYRQGQIDCATGRMGYVLTTQDDSTRVWEKRQ